MQHLFNYSSVRVKSLVLKLVCGVILSCSLFSWQPAFSQAKFTHERALSFEMVKADAVPQHFLLLAATNEWIRNNKFENELLVDLVQPFEADKPLTKRKQWHRVGPLVIPLLMGGYNWRAVTMQREKFVGTARGRFGMSHKDHLTEYDVTFNLVPGLQPYKDLLCKAVQKQIGTFKGRKAKRKWKETNFSCDTLPRSHFHCELTVHRDFRHHVHQSFFPNLHHSNIKEHSSMGELNPTMGVYGIPALDCNHSCHPEIHPAEWIWWLEVHPEKPDNQSKRWVVGLFHEGSNRFKQWSRPPRIGTIAIPFLFKIENPRKHIYLNPTIMGPFEPAGMQMLNLPAVATDLNFSVATVALGETEIKVFNNQPLETLATKWWLSDVQQNGEWIWGYFNLAVSNRKVFTFKLEQSPAAP